MCGVGLLPFRVRTWHVGFNGVDKKTQGRRGSLHNTVISGVHVVAVVQILAQRQGDNDAGGDY